MISNPILGDLERIRAVLPQGVPVYLVGGGVRDLLLGRSIHDLDFVLPAGGLEIARHVADALKGAYYPLDEARETGRVVLIETGGSRRVLDFSVLRGPDLESDLRARDFTLNAIALDLHNVHALIDPLGGAGDLRARQLRACSPTTFHDDPLRVLRGVRLAAAFSCQILPDTRKWMREAVSGLSNVSPERIRDELFRLLNTSQPAASIQVLDLLGALSYVLPELPGLKGVTQSPPHVLDVWSHTLRVVQKLETLLDVLALQPEPEASANLAAGLVAVRIGRFREQIAAHLEAGPVPDRTHRPLLFLAALYHDVAKPQTRQVEPGGRIRFLEHEQAGAELAGRRGRALRLSSLECERLKKIVANHMRPLLLTQAGRQPSRRAIYRFFRDTGSAGVDVCLLSLADTLGTYDVTLPQEVWARQLDVVRLLLEAWWETPAESVAPAPLINGHDLMKALDLLPGEQVGRLLEAIREGQATGQVTTREQALELAKKLLALTK